VSVESVLARGRRAAEAILPSTGTIRRHTGTRVTGPDGIEVDGWTVTYTDHPMRLRDVSTSRAGAAPRTTGRAQQGVEVNHARHIVALRPFDDAGVALDLADGDVIEVTSGENAGAILRIVESDWADDKTTRRVPVEATERPRGW
jgi:hypothetical protein